MNEVNKIIYNTTRVPVLHIIRTRTSTTFTVNNHASFSTSNPTRDCVYNAIYMVMNDE